MMTLVMSTIVCLFTCLLYGIVSETVEFIVMEDKKNGF